MVRSSGTWCRLAKLVDSPAQVFEPALAFQECIGIACVDDALLLGDAVEFLEQFHKFQPVIVGHVQLSLKMSDTPAPCDTAAPEAVPNRAFTND